MEIKKTVSSTPPAAPTKDATSPAAQSVRRPAVGHAGSTATTGEPALSVQALQQVLVAQPEPVDTARVEAIRTAIREGRLPISAEGIADAAMKAAFELLGKPDSTR